MDDLELPDHKRDAERIEGHIQRGEIIPPGVYRLTRPIELTGPLRASEVIGWNRPTSL